MSVNPGTRFGPYEILSPIGAGGMGEVYRARDTRLDRIVAIKVLPTHLADRSELRERFEREAKTIASLNHPHICTLFDIGRQDGTDYLVMEYLEGETLAHRLQKGPLPLEQTLQYGVEMSDALDKAHRKGITHRDLKPGNIMLTKTGTKLLDFGLAKLKQEAAPVDAQMTELPTVSEPLTAHGAIVGTLQYMAPEQLEGKEVDARTDIFAFGAVVYEMATGKKAFEGKSQASLIAKILETDPLPMASLAPMTPPALDRVVKRCLAKDPDDRWQSVRDLEAELKWIAERGSHSGSVTATTLKRTPPFGPRTLIAGLGALLLAAAIASLVMWNLKSAPKSSEKHVTRFTITLPPDQHLGVLTSGDAGRALAISPDGLHLVYDAWEGSNIENSQIYLRSMDSLQAKPIPGTKGGGRPFFSPDGQWVAFFADGKLKKVSLSGEEPQTICDATREDGGASWSTQGALTLGARGGYGSGVISQISAGDCTPRPLTHLGQGEVVQAWPEILPGGKAVIFASGTNSANWANAQIAVEAIGSGERKNLVQGGMQPRYAPSGHLVYAQGGGLKAIPFDAQRLTVNGTSVPVVDNVMQSTVWGDAQYSVSDTGTLVYVPQLIALTTMVWVDRNGKEQPLAAPVHAYLQPRISPDGQRVAVGITEQDSEVWIYDLSRGTLGRFTFEGKNNLVPYWTPDGKSVAFVSNMEGPRNLFWQHANGSGGLERLSTSQDLQIPSSWSPDGQSLAFTDLNAATGFDIWVLRLGDRKAQPFLQTQFNEREPQFSPDGRWIAYSSDESGRYEIYVQPFPGPGGKWQISTDGGREVLWNRNGRELFYRNRSKLMAVPITTQPNFSAGTPKALFEGDYQMLPAQSTPNYDVSADGQRFLMLKAVEQPAQINVVLNWFEELKQKVPAGGKQ